MEEGEIIHKITEAKAIMDRVIVCGKFKYNLESSANSSLYWKDVNCISCLTIGALRHYLKYYGEKE